MNHGRARHWQYEVERTSCLGWAIWVIAFTFAGGGCSNFTETTTSRCESNLRALGVVVRQAAPSSAILPTSLAELAPFKPDASLFVCPATKHQAGDIRNLVEWSDYIYVGGLLDYIRDQKVAMLICPPENHGGIHGYVVYLNGEVEQVASSLITRMIAQPWVSATNNPAVDKEFLRTNAIVHVPKRFLGRYPDAYQAKPSHP